MIPPEQRPLKGRWILSSRDLPPKRTKTSVSIDGQSTTMSGRKLQVAEALKIGPINCASTVRLSDSVLRLKLDHGVQIITERPIDGPAFYSLKSDVEVIT